MIESKLTPNASIINNVGSLSVAVANGFGVFDHQTLDRVGVAYVKVIAEKVFSSDDDLVLCLNKLSNSDTDSCRSLLMALDYQKYRGFLNSFHKISTMCELTIAEELVNCGASPSYSDIREVIIHAFFNNQPLFEEVFLSKGKTQPFPDKAYQPFARSPNSTLEKRLEKNLAAFEQAVSKLYSLRGCTNFVRVTMVKNDFGTGLMIEHGTPKSGFSILDDSNKLLRPESQALRLRNTDYVFVDKINQILWVNSILLVGQMKSQFLAVLSEFFCNNPMAYVSPVSVGMDSFNSPAVASNLKGFEIPAIKLVELRKLVLSEVGIRRGNKTIVSGPFRKGCATEADGWSSKLPTVWQSHSVELAFETATGVRESLIISHKSVTMSCSPNFNLAIAMMNYLKVIPNYGN